MSVLIAVPRLLIGGAVVALLGLTAAAVAVSAIYGSLDPDNLDELTD